MPAVERRISAFSSHVLKILRAAGRKLSGEEIGGAVVDQMAPGIGRTELQTRTETPVELQSETVIDRISAIHEVDDCVGEPECRKVIVGYRAQVVESQRQRIEGGLRR